LNDKKSKWNPVLALAVFVMFSTSAVCQQLYSLSGTIQSTDGLSIPGANIAIDHTQLGTVSDAKGHYLLENIPAGNYILLVSALGYQTYTTPIEVGPNSQSQYHISLNEKTYAIDDIEVVGKSVASQVNEQAIQ